MNDKLKGFVLTSAFSISRSSFLCASVSLWQIHLSNLIANLKSQIYNRKPE
ncbi:MAG: hypothetical protein QOH63_2599 [Acidobacteriota bacterium]|jgi:hypothetical protein|nr:hypothetical protein [Acidobacteriota bacterium]